MDQRCSNCLYSDIDVNAEPCACCSRYLGTNCPSYWMPEIEDIKDDSEILRAILKNQMYIRLEIGSLRDKLNELKE